MGQMIVVNLDDAGDRRCLDEDGHPLCEPADCEVHSAFLVDDLTRVTCPICISISNVPAGRLSPPGEA